MTENIRVLTHSSIKIKGTRVVYADPFQIEEASHDADYILITHDHYDHFSPEDIAKILKEDTLLVVPEKMKGQAEKETALKREIVTIKPGEEKELDGIRIEAVAAYNKMKPFHPRAKEWVGYLITLDGSRIYVAGDTDITEENQKVVCDIAMVPIGGTYTMDARKAAKLVNIIKPGIAIPTHYGSIVGKKSDEEVFRENVDKEIKVEIKMGKA